MLINVRVKTELFKYNSFILLFKYINRSVVFFCLYTVIIIIIITNQSVVHFYEVVPVVIAYN